MVYRQKSARAVIVGAPCREKPTSVVISLDSGGRRVLVGAQTALSDDGKVVGKGDMRAQIEQVGKNIQACLKAAGASTSDIVLTRAYVTDADAFKQNADVRTLYLGPESPTSTVNTVPKAVGRLRLPRRDRSGRQPKFAISGERGAETVDFAAARLAKSGLFQSFEQMVARFLRAELSGETSGHRRTARGA